MLEQLGVFGFATVFAQLGCIIWSACRVADESTPAQNITDQHALDQDDWDYNDLSKDTPDRF